jgi:hypothetical protein
VLLSENKEVVDKGTLEALRELVLAYHLLREGNENMSKELAVAVSELTKVKKHNKKLMRYKRDLEHAVNDMLEQSVQMNVMLRAIGVEPPVTQGAKLLAHRHQTKNLPGGKFANNSAIALSTDASQGASTDIGDPFLHEQGTADLRVENSTNICKITLMEARSTPVSISPCIPPSFSTAMENQEMECHTDSVDIRSSIKKNKESTIRVEENSDSDRSTNLKGILEPLPMKDKRHDSKRRALALECTSVGLVRPPSSPRRVNSDETVEENATSTQLTVETAVSADPLRVEERDA